MKRTLVGVILGVLLFGAGAKAQDTIFAFRAAGFVDIPITQPCGDVGLKGAASMTVYDTNPFIVYTCNDDRVILRRYFNPNDKIQVPTPVFVVKDPFAEFEAHPVAVPIVCPGNFVHTADLQGCVPPNHPLAPKR